MLCVYVVFGRQELLPLVFCRLKKKTLACFCFCVVRSKRSAPVLFSLESCFGSLPLLAFCVQKLPQSLYMHIIPPKLKLLCSSGRCGKNSARTKCAFSFCCLLCCGLLCCLLMYSRMYLQNSASIPAYTMKLLPTHTPHACEG